MGKNQPSSQRRRQQPAPAQGPFNLHAPWRISYMDMLSTAQKKDRSAKPEGSKSKVERTASCFIREYWLNPERDDANLVVVRTGVESKDGAARGGMILLNRYPYANGHLMVALGEGRSRLLDYSESQRAELWSLADLAVELCERTLEPQGLNIGVNQGMAAGAGVPEHLHVHVVPRWAGDVNFMAVCAHIRVIPGALEDMWRRYRAAWNGIRGELGIPEPGAQPRLT